MKRLVVSCVLVAGAGVASASPQPYVRFLSPKIKGELDPALLAKSVSTARNALLACYRKALTRDPKAEGTATTTFTIAPDGKVSALTISKLEVDSLKSCVSTELPKVRFSAAKDRHAVDVSYLIEFSQVDLDAAASHGILGTEDSEGSGAPDPDAFGYGKPLGGPPQWGTLGSPRPITPRPITLGTPSMTGETDKATLRRDLTSNLPKLQSCYDKALASTPTLSGTLVAEFTIAGDGKVSGANVSERGLNAVLASCVKSVIAAIPFAKPKTSSVTVKYPLVFQPPTSAAKKP
jgi:hypothetical protein